MCVSLCLCRQGGDKLCKEAMFKHQGQATFSNVPLEFIGLGIIGPLPGFSTDVV